MCRTSVIPKIIAMTNDLFFMGFSLCGESMFPKKSEKAPREERRLVGGFTFESFGKHAAIAPSSK
jgi:hypothetical protein